MIVVSAGILERDGRLLLAQRKINGRLPLKWEFPGGKLERGETPEQALERELMEELGVQTRTGRIYDARVNESGDILILFYRTEIVAGEPKPLDANALLWTEPDALLTLDLAPTDRRVAESLSRDAKEAI